MSDGDRYPQVGAVLVGKYVVESLIGTGGMGAVIKARHRELDESVAIKCLLPEMQRSPDIVARFLREARAAVKLKNAHVARIHDVGKLDDGTPYIVMEHLDGGDLAVYLRARAPLSIGIAIDLVLQACEAIAEAHSIGVIHRDIKLSNFALVDADEEPPQLKVLDFGIASSPEGATELTTTESVFGTPSYMAPEQMRSLKVADERSDIWSLGVVAYELIESARPFRAEVYAALCLAVAMDPPSPMTRPDPALEAAILKCLEKDPERRYQTAAELAAALAPFAADRARATTMAEECARLLRRTPHRRTPVPQDPPFSTHAPTVKDSPHAMEPTVVGQLPTTRVVTRRMSPWMFLYGGLLLVGVVLAIARPWATDPPVRAIAPPPPVLPPAPPVIDAAPAIDNERELAKVRASLYEEDGRALDLAKAAIAKLSGLARTEAKMLYGDALFQDGRYRKARAEYKALLAEADDRLRGLLEQRIRDCDKQLGLPDR